MQGNIFVMGFFSTFGAPLVISVLLFMDRLHFYDLAADDEKRSLRFMVVIQALQLFFIWFMTFFFNPDNKAIRIISMIMFACLVILFPLITMICVLVFHSNGTIKDTTMSTWFWIYFSLQAVLLLTVLGSIITSCIIARRNQGNGEQADGPVEADEISKKEVDNSAGQNSNKEEDAKGAENGEASERKSYKLRGRDAGSGPVRLENILELEEDIYSLFFVSTMHPDYIYYYHEFVDENKADADFFKAK